MKTGFGRPGDQFVDKEVINMDFLIQPVEAALMIFAVFNCMPNQVSVCACNPIAGCTCPVQIKE